MGLVASLALHAGAAAAFVAADLGEQSPGRVRFRAGEAGEGTPGIELRLAAMPPSLPLPRGDGPRPIQEDTRVPEMLHRLQRIGPPPQVGAEPIAERAAEPERAPESPQPELQSASEPKPAPPLALAPEPPHPALDPPPAHVAEAPRESAAPVAGGEGGARSEASLEAMPAPVYPSRCRRLGHEGRVLLECVVDEAGRAVAIGIIRSSGCQELDRSAVSALEAARFDPATLGGRPVRSMVRVPVRFALR